MNLELINELNLVARMAVEEAIRHYDSYEGGANERDVRCDMYDSAEQAYEVDAPGPCITLAGRALLTAALRQGGGDDK